MKEQDIVYENIMAEKFNGILKDEFCLDEMLLSKEIAMTIIKESMRI